MFQHFDRFLNVRELLEETRPQLVVELGAGSGNNTRKLKPWCDAHGAQIVIVSDGVRPSDLPDVDWRQRISYLELPKFEDGCIDVAIVDTDHNSWTVACELKLLTSKLRPGGLALLHDTESFFHNSGYMPSYGTGDPYPLSAMLEDTRTFTEAVRSFIGDDFILKRESRESSGAMALERR